MKQIYSKKLLEAIKKINGYLIISIVLAAGVMGCVLWAYNIANKPVPKPIYLNNAIINNMAEVYSNVEVVALPYVFAKTSNDEYGSRYYFVTDDEYVYITYLDYDTYSTLNHENIEDNPVVITGVTQSLPSNVKQIAIEAYNELMESEIINEDNFASYLGTVYLDTTVPFYDNSIAVVLSMVLGVIFIIVFVMYLVFKTKTTRTIKKTDESTWQQINNEIENPNTNYYKPTKLYLTQNYIIDFSRGMNIIKYTNILWFYPFELKQYGITTTKSIIIYDKNNKKHIIANISNFGKKNGTIYQAILNVIADKNPKALLGFTEENRQEYKKLIQKNKHI